MAESTDTVHQAGVIAVRGRQVCLVMSSGGKRWVLPKGCFEPGKSAQEIALQEAWEEAGLVGVFQGGPVGSYIYEKLGKPHHVLVFVLRVTEARDAYPEKALRQRIWLKPSEVLPRLEDKGLQDIVRHVFKRKKRRRIGKPQPAVTSR